MARWTLSDLMSKATTRAGRRSDISASEVSFWVNEAYLDFVRDIYEFLSEKTATFSVNSGTSQLNIPDDFREAISLSEVTTTSGHNRELKQLAPEHADRQGYYPVGPPQGYFLYGDKIQLQPSANSFDSSTTVPRELLLRYRWIPSEMTATAAVPSVATEHRRGILLKSEQYIHELVGNIEEAAMAEIRYTAFVSSLKDAVARRHAARGKKTIRMEDQSARRSRDRPGNLTVQNEWLRR